MADWNKRFMNIAKEIATWSSCYRKERHVGAVIVKDRRIIATGYNGAPSGIETCKDRGYCWKKSLGIQAGHASCYAIHAEENALLQAAKLGIAVQDATLYCTHQPCSTCLKSLLNSGIKTIYYEIPFIDPFTDKLLEDFKGEINIIQYKDSN